LPWQHYKSVIHLLLRRLKKREMWAATKIPTLKIRMVGHPARSCCCGFSAGVALLARYRGEMTVPTATKADTKTIETKFNETAFRLTQERSDFFLPQVVDFVRQKKWINLRPEYQRRTVWKNSKRSLFVESLLLNVPIPPVFLYEWDLSRYEVMDGQQRLTRLSTSTKTVSP